MGNRNRLVGPPQKGGAWTSQKQGPNVLTPYRSTQQKEKDHPNFARALGVPVSETTKFAFPRDRPKKRIPTQTRPSAVKS